MGIFRRTKIKNVMASHGFTRIFRSDSESIFQDSENNRRYLIVNIIESEVVARLSHESTVHGPFTRAQFRDWASTTL